MITAKEIAEKLGLSATAVSMALNNKPGVSTETRKKIIRYAEENGYDFSKLSLKRCRSGSLYCIIYHAHNAILNYSPVFNELLEGIKQECLHNDYLLKTIHLYGKKDNIEKYIENLRISDCTGILLIATEMDAPICAEFSQLPIPVILIDNLYDQVNCSSVSINNIQGAFTATNFLISKTGVQPGYLHSAYPITNFSERKTGFEKAVKEHGLSVSNCIYHEIAPSIEGSFADMLKIIDDQNKLAKAYFADNDLIAIGAIKALQARGFRIPDDIAVIGIDNISESRILNPALTTIDIPRKFMGQTAVKQLISEINNPVSYKISMKISTSLMKRESV